MAGVYVCVCIYVLCSGPVQHVSDGSRTITENKMNGPWMTSTSASSVLTCAMDMAGVIMDIAGQSFHLDL